MDDHNGHLRDQVLQVSAGWLGEGVVLISDLLGVWDIFVLSAVFILSWVIMRTTMTEISICFGLVYDLGIPLQYVCDEASLEYHKKHLEQYWPVFVIGSVIEGVMYFLSHPDLFTLIVCLKTLLCLFLWLRRGPSGDNIKLGSPSAAQGPSPGPLAPTSTPSAPSAPTAPSARSSALPTVTDPRFPNLDSQLKARYPDPEVRQGMILTSRGTEPKSAAEKIIQSWVGKPGETIKDSELQRRRAKYKKIYRDFLASQQPATGAAPSSSSGRYHVEKKIREKINEKLKAEGMDHKVRVKLATKLAAAKSYQEAVALMQHYGAGDYIRYLAPPSGGSQSSGGQRQPEGSRSAPTPPAPPADTPLVQQAKKVLGSDGLGVPNEVADLMCHQISKMPQNDAAKTLGQWKAVYDMPKDNNRTKAIQKMMKPYEEPLWERQQAEEAEKERAKRARNK